MFLKEFLSKLLLFGLFVTGINVAVNYGLSTNLNIIPVLLQNGFFSVLSIAILTTTSVIFKKNKDVVGMSFLLSTSIKTALVFVFWEYVFVSPIELQKWIYFSLFISYLLFETYLIGKKLNQITF